MKVEECELSFTVGTCTTFTYNKKIPSFVLLVKDYQEIFSEIHHDAIGNNSF